MLCDAASRSDLALLTTLVENGAPIDQGDYGKRTALHLAASEGLLEVVTFLIEECGADPNPVDRWNGECGHACASSGTAQHNTIRRAGHSC